MLALLPTPETFPLQPPQFSITETLPITSNTYENALKRRIHSKTKVKPVEAVVTIAGSNFAVRGDISFISGMPKAGKSNVCRHIISTCFSDSYDARITLNIRSVSAGRKKVIYIDTEQPEPYTLGMYNKICKSVGVADIENFEVFNIREFTPTERQELLFDIFENATNEHLYLIDGAADFVESINDERECNTFINALMKAASQKYVPIILVLHENPGGGKMRGHFGSEAERKCGGTVSIKKDSAKNIHWIEPKFLRGTRDFEKQYFSWCDTEGDFVLADDTVKQIMSKQHDPEQKKYDLHLRTITQCFTTQKELTSNDLIQRIVMYYNPAKPISTKTASRVLKYAIEQALLIIENNIYRFTPPNL